MSRADACLRGAGGRAPDGAQRSAGLCRALGWALGLAAGRPDGAGGCRMRGRMPGAALARCRAHPGQPEAAEAAPMLTASRILCPAPSWALGTSRGITGLPGRRCYTMLHRALAGQTYIRLRRDQGVDTAEGYRE